MSYQIQSSNANSSIAVNKTEPTVENPTYNAYPSDEYSVTLKPEDITLAYDYDQDAWVVTSSSDPDQPVGEPYKATIGERVHPVYADVSDPTPRAFPAQGTMYDFGDWSSDCDEHDFVVVVGDNVRVASTIDSCNEAYNDAFLDAMKFELTPSPSEYTARGSF